MKARELRPIYKAITNRISDTGFHKTIVLLRPLNGLLRAVHLDASAFSKESFTATAFYKPLCVPSDCLTLTFGRPIFLPGGSWSMLMPDLIDQLFEAITTEAIPFLSQAPTLCEMPSFLKNYFGNPHAPKAAAYALARIGEHRQAIALIEDFLPKFDLSSHWQRQIDEDFRALRHLLLYEPVLAAAKLEQWENDTIHNLGLQRFCAADGLRSSPKPWPQS